MSLDWESSPSPSAGRDWFFPSPSFIRSSSHSQVTPQYPRRFSKHRLSRPYSPNTTSPPTSTNCDGFNRARIRRRVKFSRSNARPETLDRVSEALSGENVSHEKKLIGFSICWQIIILVATLSVLLSISLSFRNLQMRCRSLFLCGCGRRWWPLLSPSCCCSEMYI